VWTAHRYASGDPLDGGQTQIPTLKAGQADLGSGVAQTAEMNEDKSNLLRATFFPDLVGDDMSQLMADYPTPRFKYSTIMDEQVTWQISKLGPYKAPGPDGILNIVLM